jgi:hypothetical protein
MQLLYELTRDFFRSFQATVKLQEIENQLARHDMSDRHGYLASAVVDISAVALHCGRSLMARIGPNIPTAKGIETAVRQRSAQRLFHDR